MQFCWNLQLLTRYSLLRNLPCSTTSLLTVEADRISAALSTSDVTRIIACHILNVFDKIENILVLFTKLSFIVFLLRCFLLLNHFLVVEDFGLSKITRHLLSMPIIPEHVRILSWAISFFFYFTCLLILCNITIWADDTALNSS